jgi:hypothetical protein
MILILNLFFKWSDLFKFFIKDQIILFFALCCSPTARNTICPFEETNYLTLKHLKNRKKIDFENQERNIFF